MTEQNCLWSVQHPDANLQSPPNCSQGNVGMQVETKMSFFPIKAKMSDNSTSACPRQKIGPGPGSTCPPDLSQACQTVLHKTLPTPTHCSPAFKGRQFTFGLINSRPFLLVPFPPLSRDERRARAHFTFSSMRGKTKGECEGK